MIVHKVFLCLPHLREIQKSFGYKIVPQEISWSFTLEGIQAKQLWGKKKKKSMGAYGNLPSCNEWLGKVGMWCTPIIQHLGAWGKRIIGFLPTWELSKTLSQKKAQGCSSVEKLWFNHHYGWKEEWLTSHFWGAYVSAII